MDKQKYNNYPLAISQILGLIEANDIAIPSMESGDRNFYTIF
jgi:hypothetical protein